MLLVFTGFENQTNVGAINDAKGYLRLRGYLL